MRSKQRGDTIIEVLLAVTVFSLLAVGTMVIMNRGMAIAERSLEMTLVRQQIDGQADLIRYIHSQYAAKNEVFKTVWDGKIIPKIDSAHSSEGDLGRDRCPDSFPAGTFALRPPKTHSDPAQFLVASYKPAETYAKIVEDRGSYVSHGIYVRMQRVQTAGASSGTAYDVYINACWDSVDGGRPQTMGTIVRLYGAK